MLSSHEKREEETKRRSVLKSTLHQARIADVAFFRTQITVSPPHAAWPSWYWQDPVCSPSCSAGEREDRLVDSMSEVEKEIERERCMSVAEYFCKIKRYNRKKREAASVQL